MAIRKFITIFLSIWLTSCNLPTKVQVTPTNDGVATAVQGTLTALAEIEPTIQPSITSTPMIEPSPALILSSTPSPEPTNIPSIDPQLEFGQPTLRDSLDNPNSFGLAQAYEDSVANISISSGLMHLRSSNTVGWRTWRVRPPDLNNTYIEAKISTITCSGNDIYGIVTRAPDYESGHGYYFALHCDGRYSLSRWDPGGTKNIVPITSDSSIIPGAGQTNRLGILLEGNKISLFINGKLVNSVEDTTFNSGYFGVFLGGYSGNLYLEIDEIAYWVRP